ncbi:MAG: hypothetical protein J6C26_09040 [Clostridia bacterium]|nr:hypothetical protein [Clostridia bacterium]
MICPVCFFEICLMFFRDLPTVVDNLRKTWYNGVKMMERFSMVVLALAAILPTPLLALHMALKLVRKPTEIPKPSFGQDLMPEFMPQEQPF